MLQKSPELMQEIVDFVDRFHARHGRSPSCREIESGSTLKRSSVHNYLVAMDEQGMIEYNGQTILTPKIRDLQRGIRQVGIVGSIACGTPIDEVEELEGYFPVPTSIVGDDEMYILYASGKSMIDIGIQDGDKCAHYAIQGIPAMAIDFPDRARSVAADHDACNSPSHSRSHYEDAGLLQPSDLA